MHERDRRAEPARDPAAPATPRAAAPAALALQRAAGNRAVARTLQRMEAAEAAETLEKSLATGVLGAERQVSETLTAFTADPAGYAELAEEYERRTETPLAHRPPPL